MRRKLAAGCFLAGMVLLAAACSNMTIFNKIQVKGSPSVNLPLGDAGIEAEDILTAEKISKTLGEKSRFQVYDYTGGSSRAMSFLMRYPILDMPLNFDEYLEKLDLSDLGATIPKVEILIPTFGMELAPQTLGVPGTGHFAGRTLSAADAQHLNSAVDSAGALGLQERKLSVSSKGLRSATFSEGNRITLTLEPTMGGLSVSSASISVTLPGSGETIPFVHGGGSTYSASLANKSISNGELSISGAVTVTSRAAAGDRVPEAGLGVRVAVALDLDKGFRQATVEVPAGTSLTRTVSTPLPEEMTKLVSRISFNSIGVAVTLDNGLPKGNDISVAVSSSTLQLSNVQETFPADARETKAFSKQNMDLAPATTPAIDLQMAVALPGHNTADNTFTVQDVMPGTPYSLEGSVAFDVDWKEATIKTSTAYEGTYPPEGEQPISLSDAWRKIPKGIDFKEIGAYLYLEAPMNMTMKGYMTANGSALWGSQEHPDTLKGTTVPPEPPGGQWNSPLDPTKASADFSQNLLALIKGRPETLSFHYSLTADELQITKASVSSTQRLQAVMLLALPLELEVDSTKAQAPHPQLPFTEPGVAVDIFALAEVYSSEPGANNDLFKRTEPWNPDSEANKLLGQLESMPLEVAYTNRFDASIGAWLLDPETGISKHFTLKAGKGATSLTLNGADIQKIMGSHPFAPRLYGFIPNTSAERPFILNRDGGINLSLTVRASTAIDYTYDFKGGN